MTESDIETTATDKGMNNKLEKGQYYMEKEDRIRENICSCCQQTYR